MSPELILFNCMPDMYHCKYLSGVVKLSKFVAFGIFACRDTYGNLSLLATNTDHSWPELLLL